MHCRYVVYITYAISVYNKFATVFALLRLVRCPSIRLNWTIDQCTTSNHGTIHLRFRLAQWLSFSFLCGRLGVVSFLSD